MKRIKKALGLLCGSTVVFLLFIGTDQSAVTSIAKGIVHTAWLSVAPILRNVSTAPQLRIDPARTIQSPGGADFATDGIPAPASADAKRIPTLSDAAPAPTPIDPTRTPTGAGSCARCEGATFPGAVRDGMTNAPRAEVDSEHGSDGRDAEVAASSRQNRGGISASAAGSAGAFGGALGRAPSNASPPAAADRGTIGMAGSHGIAIGGSSTVPEALARERRAEITRA